MMIEDRSTVPVPTLFLCPASPTQQLNDIVIPTFYSVVGPNFHVAALQILS